MLVLKQWHPGSPSSSSSHVEPDRSVGPGRKSLMKVGNSCLGKRLDDPKERKDGKGLVASSHMTSRVPFVFSSTLHADVFPRLSAGLLVRLSRHAEKTLYRLE